MYNKWSASGGYDVKLVKMTSAKEFKKSWNKLSDDYKMIAILSHGGPHGFTTYNGDVWSEGAYIGECGCRMGFNKKQYNKSTDILTSELKNKPSVRQLIITSCSAGHKDHKYNIAKALWLRIGGSVTSCDVGVSYRKFRYRYPRLARNQSSYYKYCNNKKNPRTPSGFYTMKGGLVY